jgi:hypothetical protein
MLRLIFDNAAEVRRKPYRRELGRTVALFFVVLGSLDVVSTDAALAAGNFEGNPFVRIMHVELGAWWGFPKVVAHVLLASLVLWLPSKRLLLWGGAMAVLYTGIVMGNFALAGWSI